MARAPLAFLILVLDDRHVLKSTCGLPSAPPPRTDFPADESPFGFIVAHTAPRVVNDSWDHEVLRSIPILSALGVRSYLTTPLAIGASMLGALVVLDYAPRSWSEKEIAQMGDVAAVVMSEIELRRERYTRERAEAEHRESESLLRSVIESTALAVAIKDLDGRYRMINEAGAAILGWGADEIIGKLDLDLVDADLAQRVRDRDRELLMAGGVALSEDDAPGAPHGVRSSTTVFKNADGEAAGLISISRVISERQRAEEALRLLHSIVARIAEAEDFSSALQLALWHVCEVTGWVFGEVWMPAADGRVLERSDIRHSVRADLLARDTVDVTSLTPGEGLAGRAWTSKQAVWVPNVEEDEAFARAAHATALGLKAGVAIPVLAAEEAVAVLVFYMYEVREQDERLVHLISVVSAQLGSLIRRKRAEDALRDSEENARRLIENLNDVIVVLDVEGRITYVSPSVQRTLGFNPQEELGRSIFDFIHADDIVRAQEMMSDTLGAPGFSRSMEVRIRHRNGHWRSMEVIGNAVLDQHGVPTIIINARDLTERQRLQAELRRMSVTDDLTGLNNRRGFFMLAEQEMKLARRLKKDLLLVFVDLDDFKSINDSHGHQVGDQALVETAEILRTTFRESDVLARLGGDEFVALAMFSADETDDVIESRLHQTLAEHNARPGRRYTVSISTGTARFDARNVQSLAELMAIADDALYEQKRARKSRDQESGVRSQGV
ncbi:MAG TPA: diguanylate cyclase [Gemmatimonadaceae bacterium]|nr:diguanylate cyclase [Gemmatimonadaceae bacterium]